MALGIKLETFYLTIHFLTNPAFKRLALSNYSICTGSTCATIPCFRDCVCYQWRRYGASGLDLRACTLYCLRHISGQDAQVNGYVISLQDNPETKMGILHAAYGPFSRTLFIRATLIMNYVRIGAGALCSPLVATQFSHMNHWSFHYLCSLGIAVINLTTNILVFRGRTQDGTSSAISFLLHSDFERFS
jgi:hypothetical protein